MNIARRHPIIALILAPFLLCVILGWNIFSLGPSGILKVAVLDVGQGDAIFIETPSGKQILVDAGPSSRIISELRRHVSFFDNSIDVIIITNPDKDHIAGFIDVLRRFDVALAIEPGTPSSTGVYKELEKHLLEEGAERMIARRGMRFELDVDIYLYILFPDRDVSHFSTNDGSIVAKLVYGATSLLLTGDATEKTESIMLSYEESMLDSDILKVGHHGSKTSTGEEFLKEVSPYIAVISAGKGNRYGHPHESVVERLGAYGVEILGTYNDGALVFESDGLVWSRR